MEKFSFAERTFINCFKTVLSRNIMLLVNAVGTAVCFILFCCIQAPSSRGGRSRGGPSRFWTSSTPGAVPILFTVGKGSDVAVDPGQYKSALNDETTGLKVSRFCMTV